MKIALASEQLAVRRRNATSLPDELGAPLVHREGAAENARACVGDGEELKRPLKGAVLAVAAVQRDKDTVEPIFDERVESTLLRVDSVGVHAPFFQGGQHHRAAFQRHGALGRAPAQEHGDFSKVAHTASPLIRTSGTSSMPKRSFTVPRACSISASVSDARALFIVNPKGKARASDIEALLEHARGTVKERFGIELVPEVRIIGEAV